MINKLKNNYARFFSSKEKLHHLEPFAIIGKNHPPQILDIITPFVESSLISTHSQTYTISETYFLALDIWFTTNIPPYDKALKTLEKTRDFFVKNHKEYTTFRDALTSKHQLTARNRPLVELYKILLCDPETRCDTKKDNLFDRDAFVLLQIAIKEKQLKTLNQPRIYDIDHEKLHCNISSISRGDEINIDIPQLQTLRTKVIGYLREIYETNPRPTYVTIPGFILKELDFINKYIDTLKTQEDETYIIRQLSYAKSKIDTFDKAKASLLEDIKHDISSTIKRYDHNKIISLRAIRILASGTNTLCQLIYNSLENPIKSKYIQEIYQELVSSYIYINKEKHLPLLSRSFAEDIEFKLSYNGLNIRIIKVQGHPNKTVCTIAKQGAVGFNLSLNDLLHLLFFVTSKQNRKINNHTIDFVDIISLLESKIKYSISYENKKSNEPTSRFTRDNKTLLKLESPQTNNLKKLLENLKESKQFGELLETIKYKVGIL